MAEPELTADSLKAAGVDNSDLEAVRNQAPNLDALRETTFRPDGTLQYGASDLILRYPTNEAKHSSRVVFYINHYTSGKLGDEGGYNDSVDVGKNYRGLGNIMSQNLRTGAAEFAGFVGSKMQVQGGSDLAKEWAEKTLKYVPQKKRLHKQISLHMPTGVQTSYGMEYSEVGLGGLTGAFIGDIASGKGLAEATGNLGTNFAKTLASKLSTAIVGAASTKFSMSDAEAALNKALGRIENPRKEVMFEGTRFRSFQMDFVFAPESPMESMAVRNIIHTFKLHMHPELMDSNGDNGMYITYPDDFDIEYRYRKPGASEDDENPYLHKFLTCVLENMHVSYDPFGQGMSTFPDGSPTHIRLTLQFKEIEPLHRRLIAEGY